MGGGGVPLEPVQLFSVSLTNGPREEAATTVIKFTAGVIREGGVSAREVPLAVVETDRRKELSSLHLGERQPVPRRTEAQQPDAWRARNGSVCFTVLPLPSPLQLPEQKSGQRSHWPPLGVERKWKWMEGPGKRRSVFLWPGEEQLSLPQLSPQ